jgi:hypothetical protein
MLGPGHTDGIRFVNNEVESVPEFKSMSDFGFQKFRKLPERCSITMLDDTFGYATQGAAYIEAALTKYGKVLPLRMVGVNKLNLAKHEVVFDPDSALLQRRVDEVAQINKSESPWELPRFESVLKKSREALPVQCAYCSFKHPCWEADGFKLREEKMGRGKVYWVEEKAK